MMTSTIRFWVLLILATSIIGGQLVYPLASMAQPTDGDPDGDDDDGGDDDDDVPDPDDPEDPSDPGDGGDPDDRGDPDTGGDPDDGGEPDAGGDPDDSGDPDDGGEPGAADTPDDDGGSDDSGAPDDDDANAPDGDDDADDDAPSGTTGSADDSDDDGDDDDGNDDAAPTGAASTSDDDDSDDDDTDSDDDAAARGGPETADSDDDDDDRDELESDTGEAGDDVEEELGPVQFLGGGEEAESERIAADERDGIEVDREGFRYRRNEFVAVDLDADDVAQLKASGFDVVDTAKLAAVGGTVSLVRGPASMDDDSASAAIDRIADPTALSFNYLFDSSFSRVARAPKRKLLQRPACGCQVGLIDTGVAATLPSFKHVKVQQRAFNGTQAVPKAHGTAVAHMFAGTGPAAGKKATTIFVADIFAGPRASSGSTFALVKAINWMAEQRVPVINISLAGPSSTVVGKAVERLSSKGQIVVAAVGNDGPAAPPVFPAAYPDVVGVTAVDSTGGIYRYANRGSYVDFAARGVDVTSLDAKGNVVSATGTSFAAPRVARLLAQGLTVADGPKAAHALKALEGKAKDTGRPGKDTAFGLGIVEID